jgi:hypothetical protein
MTILAESHEPENDQHNSRCDRPNNSSIHEWISCHAAPIHKLALEVSQPNVVQVRLHSKGASTSPLRSTGTGT